MSNGAESLKGFLYQFYLGIDIALRDNGEIRAKIIEPVPRNRTGPISAYARIAFEGLSDIDLRGAGCVRCIQVKTRGGGDHCWTLRELFEEVLLKFPGEASCDRRVFITDGDFDSSCQAVGALAEHVRSSSGHVSDEACEETLKSVSSKLRVNCRKAAIWGGRALECSAAELPGRLLDLDVIPGAETISDVVRFIASVELVGGQDWDAVEKRVLGAIRRRAPVETVSEYRHRLLATALDYSSSSAGTEFTASQLLAEAGLSGDEFSFSSIVNACNAILRSRLPTFVRRSDPKYARRSRAHGVIDDLLASDASILVVVGPAKAGKTRFLAEAARGLVHEIPVFLQRARHFTVEGMARDICIALGHEAAGTAIGAKALLERAAESKPGVPFLILVDALNEVDEQARGGVEKELNDLSEIARSGTPVKVVITCSQFSWERLRSDLTAWEAMAHDPSETRRRQQDPPKLPRTQVPTFELDIFSDSELQEAIELNLDPATDGHADALAAKCAAGMPPVSLSDLQIPNELRQALHSPDVFSVFNALSEDDRTEISVAPAGALDVYRAYWQEQTDDVRSKSGKSHEIISRFLKDVARAICESGSRDYSATLAEVERYTSVRLEDAALHDDAPARGIIPAAADANLVIRSNGKIMFAQLGVLEFLIHDDYWDELSSVIGDEQAVYEEATTWVQRAVEERNDVILAAVLLLMERAHVEDRRQAAVGLARAVLDFSHYVGRDIFTQVGDPAVPVLADVYERLSKDNRETWHTAREAGRALVALSTRKSAEALVNALRSGDLELRKHSAELLGDLVSPPPGAIEVLTQALGDPDDEVRRAAQQSLVRIGSECVPHLVQRLGERDDRLRSGCIGALGGIGHRSALEALRELKAADLTAQELLALIVALGRLDDSSSSDFIADHLQHEDADIRGGAAYSLIRLQPESSILSLEKVLRAPASSDQLTIEWTMAALSQMGDWRPVAHYLRTAIHHRDWPVRGMLALWRIAEMHHPVSVRALLEELSATGGAPVPSGRRWQILRRLTLVETLEEALEFQRVRHYDAELWWESELATYNVAATLPSPAGRWQTEPGMERRYALSVLMQLGSERSVEALADILINAEDQFLRREAAELLGAFGTAGVLDRLADAQNAKLEPWNMTRREACIAAGLIGGRDALDPLLKTLINDPDELVRDGALRGILSLNEDAIDTSALQDAVLDRSMCPDARSKAAFAIGQLGLTEAADNLLAVAREEQEPPEVRETCIRALAWMNIGDAEAIAQAALDHPDPDMRLAGLQALCQLQSSAIDVQRAIQDVGGETRSSVVWCVSFHRSDEAARVLEDVASSTDDPAAFEAFMALKRRDASELIGIANEIIRRERAPVYTGALEQSAVRLLAEDAPDSLVAALLEADLGTWSQHLIVVALDSLVAAGAQVEGGKLRPFLTHSDAWIRRRAGRTLSRCAADGGEAILRTLAAGSTPEAVAVAEALTWSEGEWVPSLIQELSEHVDGRVRDAIRETRGNRKSKANERSLTDAFISASEPLQRFGIGKALEQAGDENSIDRLRRWAAAESTQVQAQVKLVVRGVEKGLDDLRNGMRRQDENR